jgi:DNA polymerase-3 subunit epsilon
MGKKQDKETGYDVEITSITVGGTEVRLSKEQAKKLSDKIKKYGSNDVNVNAYIMQVVDENRGQDYFGKHRPVDSDIPKDETQEKTAFIGKAENTISEKESPKSSLEESIKKLNLQKPIVFFDTETTGLDVGVDRVISIAVTKVMPDGEMISKNSLINPTIPISKEATEIHGITNEMLVDKPKFSQVAKSMYEFMKDCYLGGYNNNFFDNAILQEEFMRCGIDFPSYDAISVDACSLFKNFEKRDLSSALKFYCNKEMENAHDADADNQATIQVFFAQLERYEELKGKSVEEIAKVCKNENWVDFQGRIIKDANGEYVWNFGKPKGKKIKTEMGFGDWVLTNNFPQTFKNLVSKILIELRKK